MIIDLRTYTLRVGTLRDFLALYAREGLPVQRRHLGAPLGYYTTEVGELNQVVHLWQYADMADRERRRAALEADPQWRAYRSAAAKLDQVIAQSNALLKAVDFAAFGCPDSHDLQKEALDDHAPTVL